MAKTKIEWCDYTLFGMHTLVAFLTNSKPIIYIKTKLWKISKFFNMMSDKISTFTIATLTTSKFVAEKNIIPPAFIISRGSLISTLLYSAILIAWRVFALWASFSGNSTNLSSRFKRVFCSKPIMHLSFFGSLAHFFSRFFAHLFPFHWGNKIRMVSMPHFFHFSFSFFSVLHV